MPRPIIAVSAFTRVLIRRFASAYQTGHGGIAASVNEIAEAIGRPASTVRQALPDMPDVPVRVSKHLGRRAR